jgi:hypothetical protein
VADIAADSTQNLSVFAAQTADSIPLNATYDAVNGTWSGGDPDIVTRPMRSPSAIAAPMSRHARRSPPAWAIL